MLNEYEIPGRIHFYETPKGTDVWFKEWQKRTFGDIPPAKVKVTPHNLEDKECANLMEKLMISKGMEQFFGWYLFLRDFSYEDYLKLKEEKSDIFRLRNNRLKPGN